MSLVVQTFHREIGGRTLSLEIGRVASQANGAVIIRYADTVALVTACMSNPREGADFFPLTVDYEERLYAAGKIPGSWFRREGRPTTSGILSARLTDRPLRPLFPKGFRNEVQIIVTILSADQENDPDILSISGASAALVISDIPFEGPVAAVRVGYLDGEFIINPTFAQLKDSRLDLVVAGTRDAVVMVEAGVNELPEDIVMEAIRRGQEANQEIISLQEELMAALAKPKIDWQPPEFDEEVQAAVDDYIRQQGWDIVSGTKDERAAVNAQRQKELVEAFVDRYPADQVLTAFSNAQKRAVRASILEGVRADGRRHDEIRPIHCEVGLLPRTHGSALFSRGETQALTIATLGSLSEQQNLDSIDPEESKRFIHHYNFPPFSVGEIRPLRGPSRRDTGHGALAERALEPVVPSEEEFPYTIRLVSEILSSNGSTSMASVCGSTLSLMDAGVPIKAPVAGIAMGLIKGEDGNYAILTDIAGLEDHFGDMDFKVAGTAQGITALQMDIKIKGLSFDIMERALEQARQARLYVLERMLETLPETRAQLSPFAPRMYRIQIPQDKIGAVIGPGGRTIRSIIEETKCTIDIQDDGVVFIGSLNEETAQRAISIIEGLTREVEVGEIYTGRVTRIVTFGAFDEVLPGKEGLVRVEELADHPVRRPEDVVQVNDEIMVMVIEVDSMGRINLSRRAVLEGKTLEEALASSRQAASERQERGPRRMPSGGRPQGDRFHGERRPQGMDRGPRAGQRSGGGPPRGAPSFRRGPGEPPPPPPSPPMKRW
ncbi:MAG TPA: polyribonucleotide nucleotidyltransferase [Dehalococcoidia bacterium]|nr:polyribonucleotide nucleotidyltransferase [Dehalococcoidia bacterium]